MNNKGQSSVEYIMLLVVMVTIALAAFGKIRAFMVENPDSFLNSYIKSYEQVFGGSSTQGSTFNYKRFPIHR